VSNPGSEFSSSWDSVLIAFNALCHPGFAGAAACDGGDGAGADDLSE
jgi:hypothetical protein